MSRKIKVKYKDDDTCSVEWKGSGEEVLAMVGILLQSLIKADIADDNILHMLVDFTQTQINKGE